MSRVGEATRLATSAATEPMTTPPNRSSAPSVSKWAPTTMIDVTAMFAAMNGISLRAAMRRSLAMAKLVSTSTKMTTAPDPMSWTSSSAKVAPKRAPST